MPSIASISMLVTVKSPDGARLLADDELDELADDDEELDIDERLELESLLDGLLEGATELLDKVDGPLDDEPDDPGVPTSDGRAELLLGPDATLELLSVGAADELEPSEAALLEEATGGSIIGGVSSTISGAASSDSHGTHSAGAQQPAWPGYGGYGGYGAYGAYGGYGGYGG